jgi:hypothetical protein
MSLRSMAARSLPAATLAAIVVLAIACPAAGADAEGDASAGPSGSGAPEAPVPAVTTGGDVQALARGAQSAVAGAEAKLPSGPVVAEQGSSDAPPAEPTSPPGPATATPAPPAPQEPPATTATSSTADQQPPPEQPARGDAARPLSPTPPSTPPKGEASKVVPTSTAPPLPTSTATLPTSTAPAAEPSVPAPAGVAPAPAPKRGSTLERLLTDADRGLREVQGQIGALKRRLGAGDLPPNASLVRVRQGLDRIAPVLLALETRLDRAPPLTPRLKALLHRVHSRLERTQDSAGELIAAFVRSGAAGPALRLLLRDLERFVAFDSTPAPPPGATRAATPAPGPLGAQEREAYTAYTPIAAAPAAAPRDGVTAFSPGRRGDGRHWAGQKVPGGPEHVPPSPPASASASATPGGALFAAGLAALAALVVALALPALRVRLDLVAGRPCRAAFVSPLERPG